MTPPHAGYKGAIYLGAVKVSGMATWTYSGETRNMSDIDEFEDEIVKQLPLQIVGGDHDLGDEHFRRPTAGDEAGKRLQLGHLHAGQFLLATVEIAKVPSFSSPANEQTEPEKECKHA